MFNECNSLTSWHRIIQSKFSVVCRVDGKNQYFDLKERSINANNLLIDFTSIKVRLKTLCLDYPRQVYSNKAYQSPSSVLGMTLNCI